MNYNSKARDFIIKEFIASLEQDTIPWHKPWKINMNATTKTEYRGVNQVLLNYVASRRNYKDPRWCTFKQAKENNWQIKKGEKGTPIEYWSFYDKAEKKNLTIAEANKLSKHSEKSNDLRMISKTYYVFNASQITNMPEITPIPTKTDLEFYKDVNTILHGMGVSLHEQGSSAFYLPDKDEIFIPPSTTFDSLNSYCSTLLHEMAHATGHESRLHRELSTDTTSLSYAKEELRAEITSSFLSANLNSDIASSVNLDNHKAYIQSWINILNDSPNELFAAIKDAEKISDFMMELSPGKEHEIPTSKSLEERIERAKSVVKNNKAMETLDVRKDSHER